MLKVYLDMTDDEIDQVTGKTIEEIKDIGEDYQTTMRLLGAMPYNRNKSAMQAALEIYPELFRDVYSREILKSTKKSLVKQAKGGRLRVNGKYLFLSPDLYAFCEWLFKGIAVPDGLLQNGEVSCDLFENNKKLDCLRSPHLMKEHSVRTNVRNKEISKWFVTKCVYTSTKDLISKVLQFD